ncbi:hypothetical protein FQA39_LY10713 [Lamprigera yunnana]|nr:hypothetical protein FQA39_LY10713 [Lamprigera yunnana]
MWHYTEKVRVAVQEYIVGYIDIDFTLWLTWLLAPLIITFVLPLMIVILLYSTALILYIYKLHWSTLRRTYGSGGWWDAARKVVAAIWDAHGWIWHGYEVSGIENIPDKESALFIYYHGAIPVDLYYFLAKILLVKNRLVHTVADHFLFKIPGFAIMSECMKVIPGTVQSCSNVLKEGNLLAISPGGVYESQFSQQYNLMWKRRLGFAKVAIDARVQIIPMFTENVREAFRTVSIGRKLFLKLYSITKFPFTPIYGAFPVKMITHIGKPILFDLEVTPEQLQTKVANAINELILNNQRMPGSIMHALIDRIPSFKERHKPKNI